MPPLDSKCLAAVDYDPLTRTLLVRFCSGPKIYSYYGVPHHVFRRLVRATGKHGEFFHAHIAGRYKHPNNSPALFNGRHYRPHPGPGEK